MRTGSHLFSIPLLAFAISPAAAQAEVNYPNGSLAYEAIAAKDYHRADTQLRKEVRVPKDDPARLINHGHVMAKTGRLADAARLFEKALNAEEIELILADGTVMSSRDAARKALESVSVGGPESPDR